MAKKYTAQEQIGLFFTDFSIDELYSFNKKGWATVQEMTKGNKVILEDSLLDYLRDFFNDIYDGEPIPKVFDRVLIEWKTVMNIPVNIYVVFPDNKPNWVYLDIYVAWRYAGRIVMPNVPIADSERVENGRFRFHSPFYSAGIYRGSPNEEQAETEMVTAVRDIFMYVYLYIAANREDRTLFKEEVVSDGKNRKKQNAKGGKKQSPKPQSLSLERNKIYVPKTRRIYSMNKRTVTEEGHERLVNYVYERWSVRGYTYTRKDGKVVNVKEHLAYRHKPNLGIKKDQVVGGNDYILRKADA